MLKRLVVEVPEEIHMKIKTRAAREKSSIKEIVNEVLATVFDNKGSKKAK